MKPTTTCTSRKQPTQERSRQTVRAILEATAQVLVQRGYEGTTTGAVVERAGVSIGTLYQYFPNKESLVAALIEGHVREVLELVEGALVQHAFAPLPSVLRAVIKASLDAHRLHPELHKVLVEQVPREGRLAEAIGISGQLTDLLEAHIQQRLPGLARARIRLVAFMVETTVEALTHRAIIESPRWLTTGALEQEAMDLLLPYLSHALQGGVQSSLAETRPQAGNAGFKPLSEGY